MAKLFSMNLICLVIIISPSIAKLLTSLKVLRGADGLAMVMSGSDVNKTEVSSVKLENRRTDRQIYEQTSVILKSF